MSTLRYPSSLQQRYAQTVFPVANEQIISILAKVDENTFDKLCEEPEFRSYCSDNSILSGRLYEERSYRKQSEANFDFDILKFKPKSMRWKEFYKRITNLISNYTKENYIYDLSKKGKLMEFKILYSIDKSIFNDSVADLAAAKGHLKVLKWLTNVQPPILPKQIGANRAAQKGYLNILKFLETLQPPILPNQDGANLAAGAGRFEVLKWLTALQPPILPNEYGANSAVYHGSLEVLKWLSTFNPPILPTPHGADLATIDGNLEVIKWLTTLQPPILPSQIALDYAAHDGRLEVLKWLGNLQPPVLPTQNGAQMAAAKGRIEIVNWLASKGIYPN